MDNTREKYAVNPYFWSRPKKPNYEEEIMRRLDQMVEELQQIKRILNMETDDGK